MKRSCLALCLLPLAAAAQQPPAPGSTGAPGEPPMYISSAEISGRIAKADAAERAGAQYNGGPLLLQGGFRANMEYHVGASPGFMLHETDAELFVVIEGSGIMTLGGVLVSPTRNGTNLQAASAEGGTPYRLAKGDMVLIPENVVHAVTQTDGRLVMMSMHLPHVAAAPTSGR